jgi:hypothetical protein
MLAANMMAFVHSLLHGQDERPSTVNVLLACNG